MSRIRELRKRYNISAEELAEKLNISVPYLYDIENKRRRLNEDLINKLCMIFEVSADYLLGLTDEPHSNSIGKDQDVWPHSDEDPLKDLPEEARQSVMEFIEYVKAKYRNNKKKGD
ncbi:MAG TPA: helix-turn-helix transcriptional regulator [Syntrophomonadaceae bacterium]|nr:helix-turn-helix transcriptional regulator [Syntrophomonadaceae bacterium]